MVHKLSMADLGRPSLTEFSEKTKIPLVFICDNIRSALNVGSIFRTADAFAIQEIILVGITQIPPHKEILKTALGADKSVAWSYEPEISVAIHHCKSKGYKILGIEQTNASIPLTEARFDPLETTVMILGNEVSGVSAQTLDQCDAWIEIPQSGTKHSLNVAVTAGILGWEYYKQYHQTR